MKVRMVDLEKIDIARKQPENVWMNEAEIWHNGDYRDFNDRLCKEFDTVDMKEGTLFLLQLRDLIGMNKDEQKHIAQFAVNMLCQYLLLDSPRDREVRLSSPITAKINPIIMLDLINKKTKINNFSIQVFINGKQVYKF